MSLQQIDIRTFKIFYGNMKSVGRKFWTSATEILNTPEDPLSDCLVEEDPLSDCLVEEDPSDWSHELHAYAEMISNLDPSELRQILDTPEVPPPDWLVEEDPLDWSHELSVYAGLKA
jgi:hypothetical protein